MFHLTFAFFHHKLGKCLGEKKIGTINTKQYENRN